MGGPLGVGAFLADGRLVPGDVVLDDGRVAAVGAPAGDPALIAAPGLIDLQVNGAHGVDVLTAEVAELARLERALVAGGVTAWQPTLVTAPEDATLAAVARLEGLASDDRTDRPHLVGIHLEGPFLSAARLGVHPPEHRRDPDPVLLERLTASDLIRTVTLAPELPGALALIETLVARGIVVSLGHSDADAAAAHAGFDRGATTVTHLGNAMRPFSPRDPGLFGVALTRADVTVQLIVDGHHLAPETVRLAGRAAAGRLVLVTDAVAAAGLPDGPAVLGATPVEVRGGVVRRGDGTLAGSAIALPDAVRGAVAAGIDLADALTAVTAAPARLIGRPDLGTLAAGGPADLVVLDRDLAVVRTLVAGRTVPPTP